MSHSNSDSSSSLQLSWLLSYVKPHRLSVIVLLLLSLLASALVLVQPLFTKGMIDDGMLAGDFSLLLKLALGLLAVGLLSTLLSGVTRYLHTLISARVLFALRSTLYDHLQTLSPSFYAAQRRGDLMSRIDGDVAEIQRFAIDGLFAGVSGVIGLVGAVGLLLFLSWELTLVALFLLPLEWWFLYKMRPRVEVAVRAIREKMADLSAFFIENISVMKLIQNTGNEDREMNRLNSLNQYYLQGLLRLQWLEFATHAVPSTLTSWSRAAIFLWGGYWVIQEQMALGSLIAFSTYLGMALGPVNSLLGLYLSLARVKVSLARVEDLTQAPADIQPLADRNNQSPSILPNQVGELALRNVSFSYPNSTQAIFKHCDLTIPAAAKVGVYSPSGSGKSTLVDLLMRHYDPQSGQVLFAHRDIRDFDVKQWRQAFAVVDQHTVLLRGSLRENLRYANPSASDEDLWQVIEAAQLTELVETFPDGLDSLLGENAMHLSGGQRQRIALARAMLQQPLFVILDEATSALDLDTEALVLAQVRQRFKDCTCFFISHRIEQHNPYDYVLHVDHAGLRLESRLCPQSVASE